MTYPDVPFANLPPLTIVPDPVEETENYIQYFNRLYEEIAFAVNARVVPYYTIEISDTPTDIPNLPSFGAFLVMVSGIESSQPTGTWSLCKSRSTAAGSIAVLGSQAGTNSWNTNTLTITSTADNFQIAHDRAGVTATFNISVMGTQLGNQ